MRPWQRYTAIEFAKPSPIAGVIAKTSRIPIATARDLLLGAASRTRLILGLDASPISMTGELYQFQNFAGLLVLAPGLELEVAPKFLGAGPQWREDFFLLATLSHHGRLLDNEGIRSATQATSQLATLIGRSLIEMYWRNQRRPLRAYRSVHQRDFSLEGDFDPEDLVAPGDEGFDQHVTVYTRKNAYNAVISAAAAQLATVVPDAETRLRLERISRHLPRQPAPSSLKDRQLPSRARSWQTTYDLSLDVLRGSGGTYDAKTARAPGFVMRTWQIWEHLISVSVRSSLGAPNVRIQSGHRLGRRYSGALATDVKVFPDVIGTAMRSEGPRQIIIDAKYKGHIERGQPAISNADVYEALAFSRATAINEVVLAYPSVFTGSHAADCEVGQAREFSRVQLNDVTIRAVELGVSGISRPGGLMKFASALIAAL